MQNSYYIVLSLSHLAPNTLTPVSHTTAKSPLQLHNRSAILIQFTSAALQVLIHDITTKSSSSQTPARPSQSPSLLVSGSGSRPHHGPIPVFRSLDPLCHRKHENSSSPRFTIDRNFELDLWVSLRLPTIGQQLPTTLEVDAPVCFNVAKSLTGFNLGATTPNVTSKIQQGVQMDATSNIQQCCVRLQGA